MRLNWRHLVVFLAVSFLPVICRADPLPRSVLILNESGAEVQGYADISAALRSTLRAASGPSLTAFTEYLDFNRFRGPQYQQILLTYLHAKYVDRPIGVIVANGTEALQLALRFREDEQWSQVPIVFDAVDETRLKSLMPAPNVTGRFLEFSLNDSISAARALVPNLKQIALLGDPIEKQPFRGHFATELTSATPGLTLIDLLGRPLGELKERVATFSENSAIIYTTITTDGAGNRYQPNEALESVAKVARTPIVIDVDNRLGHGGTGGFVVQPKLLGEEAAQLVLRLFTGEDAAQIPVAASSAIKPVFDWRELQRWNVDERNLPPGSEIRFRHLSTWEQYQQQIVALTLLFLIETALIVGLLYERRRRRIAESEVLERVAELAHINRVATAGELSASIAHEIKQPLAAMVAQGGAALRWLGRTIPDLNEVKAALEKIVESGHRANQIIENLRAIFKRGTNPHTRVDVNELVREVLALSNHEMEKNGITLQTALSGEPGPYVLGDRAQLEQVLLNIVMNAIEAMHSSTCRRMLGVKTERTKTGAVLLTVADSGPGIDPGKIAKIFDPFFTTKSGGMGMGLSICRSIVQAHGGHLRASSEAPHGSVFHVELPSAAA
jgi:signal transduction histidine kinase